MVSCGIHEILTNQILSNPMEFYEDLIDVSHIQKFYGSEVLIIKGCSTRSHLTLWGGINPVLALQQTWTSSMKSWSSLYVSCSIHRNVVMLRSFRHDGPMMSHAHQRSTSTRGSLKHVEIFDLCVGVWVHDHTPWKSALGSCHPDTFVSTMKPCSAWPLDVGMIWKATWVENKCLHLINKRKFSSQTSELWMNVLRRWEQEMRVTVRERVTSRVNPTFCAKPVLLQVWWLLRSGQ